MKSQTQSQYLKALAANLQGLTQASSDVELSCAEPNMLMSSAHEKFFELSSLFA